MIKLAATEIDNDGTVIAVSKPTQRYLQGILPAVGTNIYSLGDDKTNALLKEQIEQALLEGTPVEFTATIKSYHIQFTIHSFQNNKTFIYWKDLGISVQDNNSSDEKLKLLDFAFRNAGTPILLVLEDATFYDFNDSMLNLLDYTEEEFKQLTIPDIDPSFDKLTCKERWVEFRIIKQGTFPNKLKRKDGTLLDVEIRCNLINYEGKEINYSFITDMTEKKQLDEKISLIDYSFRNVSSPIFFIQEDESFLDYNEATAQLMGYTNEEFRNVTVFDINPTFNTKEEWAIRWKELNRLRTTTSISQLKRKDGALIDVEVKINIIKHGDTEINCGFYNDITEKKKLDEQLRLIDFSFRHSTSPMIFIKEDGSFLDFNAAAYTLLDYTQEEFRQLKVVDINPNYNETTWAKRWEVLRENRAFMFTTQLKRKDGLLVHIEAGANVIEYSGIEINCAVMNDITERLRLDEQLRLVDFAFRTSTIAIIFTREDGSFYDFNEAALKQYGYTEDEMKTMSVADLSINHSIESWEESWAAMKDYKTFEIDWKHKKKDGSVIDVSIKANHIKYQEMELNCSFITDITEKKKLEEVLKQNNERYEYVTKATSDVIWEHDLRTNMLYYSDNFTVVFGHELTGNWFHQGDMDNIWWQNLHPDDYAMAIEFEKQVLASDGRKWESEYRLRKADGTYAWVFDRGFAVRDENGEIIRWVGSMQDITQEKKIEEELRRSNQRHEFATLATSDVVWETDLINNTLFLSNNFTTIFGHRIDGLQPIENSIWQQNVHPDDLQRIQSSEAAIINARGEKWQSEYRFRRADGTYTTVLDRSFAVKDQNGVVVAMIGTMQDVTEKKKIEELKKSYQRYEYATLATSDVIWEADLVDATYFTSRTFTELFGHKSGVYEHIMDNQWLSNVHPDDLPKVLQTTENAINSNESRWKSEYRLKNADGEYAMILDRVFLVKDENGKPIRLVGALRNITDRKQREERLKLFETVITNTTDSVIIRDAKRLATGGLPLLYVNEAFTQMTGYSFDEIKGRTLKLMNGPLTDQTERNNLRTAIDNFEPGNMEVINYKKDGTPFWASVSIFPVADVNGVFTHWVSIQQDITNRKKAEAEKEQLLNELIHNNKELKQFGYITTHNLRAPLTNLVSICRLLDTNKIEDTLSKKLVEGFKQSTIQLNDTLNDLINILIIKENRNLPTTELGFKDMLTKVQSSISNTLLTAGAIIISDFSAVESVEFSNTYLESIFLNLLTNSLKYAHPERKPIIKITTAKDATGNIILTFSDNGVGMNIEKVRDRIFGLYQRFHKNADSKGIGLYLIHSQITALGGKIEVESEVNIGTTFTITFRGIDRSRGR